MPLTCKLGFHAWNLFICSKCGTVDYRGLVNRMHEISRIGQIIPRSSERDLSGCKTEIQKQNLAICFFNYLVIVVRQSFETDSIMLATKHLLEIQETVMRLGKCNEGHDWTGNCEKCANCGMERVKGHDWNGCKCTKCEMVRDEGHDWNGCKCTKCGMVRDEGHDWNGCKCTKCGMVRDEGHDWRNDCEYCAICGSKSSHQWSEDGKTCTRCGQEYELYLSLKQLIKELNSDDACSFDAAKSLGELGDTRAVPALISKFHQIIRQNYMDISASNMIDALAKIGDKRAVPVILQDLEERSNRGRYRGDYTMNHLIRALGQLGDNSAVPLLQVIGEHDDSSAMRDEALSAIRLLSKP